MSLSQISVGCYPTLSESGCHGGEYIYSKAMPTTDAIMHVNAQLKDKNHLNSEFFHMDKKEGRIYIRHSDIKTILIKQADANYV